MRQFKIVIEKHPEGYVAYPIGITGAVVGQGYSPDVDALLIELNNNPIAYAEEEGKTILHYSEDDQLVLIEILDFGCSLSEDARQELAKSISSRESIEI